MPNEFLPQAFPLTSILRGLQGWIPPGPRGPGPSGEANDLRGFAALCLGQMRRLGTKA
jgi:hypothetical protein